MAYQALYRQWRPTDFSSVVGQETIINTLRNQVVTDRIAHAYLFCGSRGTGKTSTAKILSRAINCEHPVNGDPCGECENCRRLLNDESLDVLEIDAASNNGVDEIRDLRETVKYPPQYGRYKVYIIDEVHMLSSSAFNALLKTLEEPPAHIVFILATTEPQKLPATILSRCQRFDFGRIPAGQIAGRLRQAVDKADAPATDDALMMIARAAEGGMRDALSILDMCLGYGEEVSESLVRRVLGTTDRSFLFEFSNCLLNEDAAGLMNMIDQLMQDGKEPIVFSKDVSRHLRSLLIARTCGQETASLLDLTDEDAGEYVEQAKSFTQTRLLAMMELFMGVETELRWSGSARLALESAALKACLRTGETDTAALADRIASLENTCAVLKSENDRLTASLDTLTRSIQSGRISVSTQSAESAAAEGSAVETQNAAVPEASAPVPPASAQNIWKEAMIDIRKTQPGLYGILSQGTFSLEKESLYYWLCSTGNDVFCGILNKDTNRKAIAEALSKAAGHSCGFEAVADLGKQQTPAGKSGEDPALKDLMSVFGRDHVTVQESPADSSKPG